MLISRESETEKKDGRPNSVDGHICTEKSFVWLLFALKKKLLKVTKKYNVKTLLL